MDARRREQRRSSHEAAAATNATSRSADDVVQRVEAHRRVVNAVSDLDEPYRTTVLLRFYEELPPREIARRMAVPVETVRTRLRRALDRLRRRLDDDHGGDGKSWVLALVGLVREAPAAVTAAATTAAVSGVGAGALAVAGVAVLAVVVWAVVVSTGGGVSVAPGERPAGVVRGTLHEDDAERETGGASRAAPVAAALAEGDEAEDPPWGETRIVRLLDLADGAPVGNLRLAVRIPGAAGEEARDWEITAAPSGEVAFPAAGAESVSLSDGGWRMPRQTPKEILETAQLWVYDSIAIEGSVRAADGSAFNPATVSLRLDLAMNETIQGRREKPWTPAWYSTHRMPRDKELGKPRADGTFFVRVPRVRGAAILAGAEGWITEGCWVPVAKGADEPARLDFALHRAPEISGVLTDADGAPLAGKRIGVYVSRSLGTPELREKVLVRPLDSGIAIGAGFDDSTVTFTTVALTAKDGTFELALGALGEVVLFVESVPGHRPLLTKLGNVLRDRPQVGLKLQRLSAKRVKLLLDGKPLAVEQVGIAILSQGMAQPGFTARPDDEGRIPAGLLESGWLYSIHFRLAPDDFRSYLLDWRGDEKVVELTTLLKGTQLTEARRRRAARRDNEKED
jgi:hypothetical protein